MYLEAKIFSLGKETQTSIHKFVTVKVLRWRRNSDEEDYLIVRHLRNRNLELANTSTGKKIIENADHLHVELKKGITNTRQKDM